MSWRREGILSRRDVDFALWDRKEWYGALAVVDVEYNSGEFGTPACGRDSANMAGAEAGKEYTYQWLLRSLGAYLDTEPSCRITLAETSDGFVVRLQRALHKLDPQVEVFRRETLVQQLQNLMNAPKRQLHVRHQGVWSSFPNGHQDFFRALGYELDEAKARGILVDELEDGIVVTYSYPSEGNGLAMKKRMVVLGRDEIETILNAAFERRGKPVQT